MNDEEYYRLRESGTGFDATRRFSVAIAIADAACRTRVGQSLALNLINIVLRFVRDVTIVVAADPRPLLLSFPCKGESFQDTIRCVHRQADPRASLTFGAPDPTDYSIGIGTDMACDLYLSCDGFIGTASKERLPAPVSSHTLVGAGVAALLGAANVARRIDGVEPLTIRLSGWNFAKDDKADQGPEEWMPLYVGTIRMIGAGAVAGALAYWLYQWGVAGDWQIVDPDLIRLKNVAKSLVFSTSEAAEIAPPGIKKVHAFERLLPTCLCADAWYHEWVKRDVPSPDVILPLANEKGVRSLIASESATVVLHATTSTQWQSHVHRHIAGKDDCIACRFPETAPVEMRCSGGSIADPRSPDQTRDASLPFVAGGSGLMLAVMLKRLQLGELASIPWNYCTWHWRTENRFVITGRHTCQPGCATYLPAETRRAVNAEGRWANLDSSSVGIGA